MEVLCCDKEIFDKFELPDSCLSGSNKKDGITIKFRPTILHVSLALKVVLYDLREDSLCIENYGVFCRGKESFTCGYTSLPVYHEFKENWDETAYFLSVPGESYNCSKPYEYRLLPLLIKT